MIYVDTYPACATHTVNISSVNGHQSSIASSQKVSDRDSSAPDHAATCCYVFGSTDPVHCYGVACSLFQVDTRASAHTAVNM